VREELLETQHLLAPTYRTATQRAASFLRALGEDWTPTTITQEAHLQGVTPAFVESLALEWNQCAQSALKVMQKHCDTQPTGKPGQMWQSRRDQRKLKSLYMRHKQLKQVKGIARKARQGIQPDRALNTPLDPVARQLLQDMPGGASTPNDEENWSKWDPQLEQALGETHSSLDEHKAEGK
jgi:hypothetical protein